MSSDVVSKKRLVSGVQPTGNLTIGNYVGSIKNWAALQDKYECYYFVADLHSLTVDIDSALLRKQITNTAALLLAAGVGERSVLFLQSHVAAHTELAWVLNCYTYFGEAKRMAQFKDKSQKKPDNINVGLFDYPVLQAADILLYQAEVVPIGIDQKQHIELTRTVAERFNNRYSPTFVIPQPFLPEVGAKIMSLAEPTIKMSKSDQNENAYVLMLDPPEVITRKIKRAVTDSDGIVKYDPEQKPGISNLLTIYSALSNTSVDKTVAEFSSLDYAAVKSRVADCIIEAMRPIRENYNRIIEDKQYLAERLREGARQAEYTAHKTLSKVYRKLGLVAPQ